ncbi:TRAP transporter large permease [Falsiroseomonas selenitidurans]|uniref:TRAP transporter large permease protein n=1 Tax=Falsiroseomonas selenitidurans TaxID=2716335 RepID=A0ABX1E0J6_9PROT|nr:TRAP transporter large permease [Falsiroseomonas selenitidurans]NKC30626.1 TRAP transporter large permease [Falsiroseomonas selenitidurans]OYW09526.1 MAG: ABC transporter permease [Rhodospirillales bacterium 12-71-4]
MTSILFLAFLGLLALGVPVAVALGAGSLIYVWFDQSVPPLVVLHRMASGIDSFPLLAVPFFVMSGSLMNSAGITERIFSFATALVGWLRGGLGHVNVVGSVIFAGMSGTAVADAGGLGSIEIKAMRDHGYPLPFAVGITGASSTIGPIIPPSLPMVIYGVMANASIGQLFAAGLIPGLLMAVTLMGTVTVMAYRRGWDADAQFRWARLGHTGKRAFLPLMTPVLLVGGMTTGAFTPTEAAIAATFYALFLGFVVYRSLTLRSLLRVTQETIETTAVVMLIVAGASIFGWLVTTTRVTEEVAALVLSITQEPWLVLLLVNILLLVVGCFLETIAAITILVPVLLPLMLKIGVDPVHFGVLMVLNLMIGLLTPPVGMVLYILARVSGLSFEQTMKACAPFLIPLFLCLGLVTWWPEMVLWLPTLIYR